MFLIFVFCQRSLTFYIYDFQFCILASHPSLSDISQFLTNLLFKTHISFFQKQTSSLSGTECNRPAGWSNSSIISKNLFLICILTNIFGTLRVIEVGRFSFFCSFVSCQRQMEWGKERIWESVTGITAEV